MVYETPVDSEEDLLEQVMAEANVGLQGIGDHVYENMEHRYHVCVEVIGCHIKPFLEVDSEEQQCTVNSRSERVHM